MHSDFVEMIEHFNRHQVVYLVVGGYAVIFHAEPRFTKDIDLLVRADEANALAVYRSLCAFGAPTAEITPADFSRADSVVQIGVAPVRIDILTTIAGVEFEEAWASRVEADVFGTRVSFISRADLIRAKLASGRAQDLIDVENLRRIDE